MPNGLFCYNRLPRETELFQMMNDGVFAPCLL